MNIESALKIGLDLGMPGVRILAVTQKDRRLAVRIRTSSDFYLKCPSPRVGLFGHRDTVCVDTGFDIPIPKSALSEQEAREFYDAIFLFGLNHEGLHAGGYTHLSDLDRMKMKSHDLQAIEILRKRFAGLDKVARLIDELLGGFEQRFLTFPNETGRWPCPLGPDRKRATEKQSSQPGRV